MHVLTAPARARAAHLRVEGAEQLGNRPRRRVVGLAAVEDGEEERHDARRVEDLLRLAVL